MGSLRPILIVDDDPDDLFILKRLLLKGGIENKIIAFEDPSAAIDHLELESKNPDQRFMPCVVFTDLHMPGMNGFELTAWVRSQARLEKLPVVVISSSDLPDDEVRARREGALRFLRKYPSSESLRALVSGLACGPS